MTAAAQTNVAPVYCPPSGINAYGQPCDPTAVQVERHGTDSLRLSPSLTYPGQTQQTLPPAISNRQLPPSQNQRVQPIPARDATMGFPFPYAGPDADMQGLDPLTLRMRAREIQDRRMMEFQIGERNEFQDLVLQSIGRDLPMFGYNLFRNVPSTFAPVDRVPVTPDYVIGPGDELLLRAWGGVELDYRVMVERDGTISIPRIGTVNVAGTRFQDLQPHLKAVLSRSFRNFDLTVSLGQLRSIQVFVVGEAMRPGVYTLSSLSTLVNALFASGGPTVKGSMRSIQLKRRNQLVSEFDLYDLLVRGDKSKDAALLPGDVIYIPPIGPLAAVAGSVNKPAIYELKGSMRLSSLLQLGGGLATTAEGQKITVERIADRKIREVEEYSLDEQGLAHAVRDGDLVQVLRLSPRFGNAVTVRGNVAVPARYPWRAGMRVTDVIPDRESLIVPDYWVKRNLIIRPDVTGREQFGLRPDIVEDLRGVRSESIADGRSRPETLQDMRQQSLQQSMQPIQQQQQQTRIDVRQALPEVNWDYAVIERLNLNELTTSLLPFSLGKALNGDPKENHPLQPGDVITIFSKSDIEVPVAKQTKFVRLEGEVATPGVYQVRPRETLRQLVDRVGGLTPNAYAFGSTFTRESTRALQQKRLEEITDRLEQEIQRNLSQPALSREEAEAFKSAGQSQLALVARLRLVRATGRIVLKIPAVEGTTPELPDIVLEDGDVFRVPSIPSTVAVMGTVYNENAFIYDGGMTVSDYLAEAGGATNSGDTDSVYIVRANGSVLSKRQSTRFFVSSFSNERLMPGDTVVVPEKLDRFRFTKELKDWSQIFYQFALGVAGLKVLRDL